MKSEPVTDRKGTPASPATARAMRVLPVPGGPTSRMPFGMRAPISAKRAGCLQEVDDLGDLVLDARRSRPRRRRSCPVARCEYVLAFERPIDMIPPIWLGARRCMYQKKRDEEAHGIRNGSRLDERGPGWASSSRPPRLLAQRGEVGVRDAAVERAGGAELLVAVLERAGDRRRGVVDLDDFTSPARTLSMKSE